MIVTDKMRQVSELLARLGLDEVAEELGLTEATVGRYDRAVRREGASEGAKVLFFDIETAPMEVYTWHLYPKMIHIGQIIKDWNIICWRAKWLGDDTILGSSQTPSEAIERDDERVVRDLYALLNEADIVIAHNLVDFDKKKANTKFLQYNLPPSAPYQVIDTLREARKNFKFSSNKLDYLCQELGFGNKINTGFDLWKKCLAGDSEALNDMYVYCGRDIEMLEELYLKLRPFIKSHPNMALYLDDREGKCSNCGSSDLTPMSRPYYTQTGVFQTYRCGCGAVIRDRKSLKREEFLMRGIAR
ncbi:MAG: RNase H superfamily protein [Candidatus Scalindua sp.]|nr:RNase H superfamily protein [Candidatus Scalindua sp.]